MRLIIAEKPSAARSIASALGADKKRSGHIEGDGILVSWCAGHLLEPAAPDAYGEKYAKWRYDDLPIIPEKWLYVPVPGKGAQLGIVTGLMRRPDVDIIVNACDSGREGELIFRHVYDYAACGKPTLRLWISSLEGAAIRAGFDNLRNGSEYDNLHAAAHCRERADWLVGLNTTRAMSALYGATLNAGRVQSPTLAMLVRREAVIGSFVKEPFYTPMIDLGGFTAYGERLEDPREAEAIRAACEGGPAIVRSVGRQKKTIAPPKLFDLTTLQREANRLFGFTAQQTLDHAQALYEKTLFSYPRTDSKFLTSDMRGPVMALVEWLATIQGGAGSVVCAPEIDRIFDDGKVGDHHAIIPTATIRTTDVTKLPKGELDLWSLVGNRLLCAVAGAHVCEAITVSLDCGGHPFAAKGRAVIEDGWKGANRINMDWVKTLPDAQWDEEDDEGDDGTLSGLSEGRVFDRVKAGVREGETTPPKRYTDDTLLSGMETAGAGGSPDGIGVERKGLGTPATRAATIEKVIKAGLVVRQSKSLVPTDKGRDLVAVLPEALTSPELTARWEHMLRQVELGEMTGDAFMNRIADFTRRIIRENNAPKPEYAGLFLDGTGAGGALGACPRCGSPVREAKKGFFCDAPACGFKMWKESRFWTAKKKTLDAAIVAALLKDGQADVKGLHSEKSGKKYDATVVLNDSEEGFAGYRLMFDRR